MYPESAVLGCHEVYEGSVPGDVIWPVVGPLKGTGSCQLVQCVVTYMFWPAITC